MTREPSDLDALAIEVLSGFLKEKGAEIAVESDLVHLLQDGLTVTVRTHPSSRADGGVAEIEFFILFRAPACPAEKTYCIRQVVCPVGFDAKHTLRRGVVTWFNVFLSPVRRALFTGSLEGSYAIGSRFEAGTTPGAKRYSTSSRVEVRALERDESFRAQLEHPLFIQKAFGSTLKDKLTGELHWVELWGAANNESWVGHCSFDNESWAEGLESALAAIRWPAQPVSFTMFVVLDRYECKNP